MAVSKYHSQKCEVDGITFDSKKEAKHYTILKKFEETGIIKNLKLQVPYVLIPKSKYGRMIKYVADFVYEENGEIVVCDTKGFKTDVYRLKKRMMAEIYGIVIKEV